MPPGQGAAKARAPLSLKNEESYIAYTSTLYALDTFIHTYYTHTPVTPFVLHNNIIPDFIASQSAGGPTSAQYLTRIYWFAKHALIPSPPPGVAVSTNNITSLAAAGAAKSAAWREPAGPPLVPPDVYLRLLTSVPSNHNEAHLIFQLASGARTREAARFCPSQCNSTVWWCPPSKHATEAQRVVLTAFLISFIQTY